MTPEQVAAAEKTYREATAVEANKGFEELFGRQALHETPGDDIALAVLFVGRMLVDAMGDLQP